MSKHLFRIFAATVGLISTSVSLHATMALRLSVDNGATWSTIMDNDVNDANPIAGQITFNGAQGNWIINVDSGTSGPFQGSPTEPYIDLNGVNLSVAPGTVIVQLSETGFTQAAASRVFTNVFGGTTQGATIFNAYFDRGNVLFGSTETYTDADAPGVSPSPTASNVDAQGPFTTAFSGNVPFASGEAGGGPYSITLEAIITHSAFGGKVTSYDDHVVAPTPPPVPSIGVTKQIACLQPTNNCTDFGKVAEGFKGLADPAFCYQITVTNNGTLTITNVTVVDSLLGDITTNFFGTTSGTLAPGQMATAYLKMALDTTTTNTAIVKGLALNADGTVNTNVMAVDNAVGIVDTAGITTTVTLSSACDEDGAPSDHHVLLPGCGEVCSVVYGVQICNTGASDLTGVTITAPGLAPFGCTLPGPFNLAKGACKSYSCTLTMACTNAPLVIPSYVTAQVAADTNHCAIYDISSTNVVTVSSTDMGTIECAACTCPPCPPHDIKYNFNGTQIIFQSTPGGSYVWFISDGTVSGLPSTKATLHITSQTITIPATKTSPVYVVPVPDSFVTFDHSVTVATTTFDTVNNVWRITLPASGLAGNVFYGGAAFKVPVAGLPGGIQNVDWSGSFTSDTPGLSVHWQWHAAAYSNFTSNYGLIAPKPVDDNKASIYKTSDQSGTPEGTDPVSGKPWKNYVEGGASGGGGANYTGSGSSTIQFTPCVCTNAPGGA